MRHYPALQPRNTTGHWSTKRNRADQARFRAALIARSGQQCEWTTNGQRCTTTTGLQAHHTQPGNNNPTTGLLLCTPHHKAIDPHAR